MRRIWLDIEAPGKDERVESGNIIRLMSRSIAAATAPVNRCGARRH
jgi:hypothetical protein